MTYIPIIISVATIYLVMQVVFLLWLWLKHDRSLSKLHTQLCDAPKEIQEQFRGRGVTEAGVRPHLNALERPLKEEIEKREYKRKLFLNRIKLFSMLKIK